MRRLQKSFDEENYSLMKSEIILVNLINSIKAWFLFLGIEEIGNVRHPQIKEQFYFSCKLYSQSYLKKVNRKIPSWVEDWLFQNAVRNDSLLVHDFMAYWSQLCLMGLF